MLFLFAGEKLSLGKSGEKKRDQLTHIFLCGRGAAGFLFAISGWRLVFYLPGEHNFV
jgi:hypothetical protein